MYVNYCKNKPDSTQLILEHAGPYFDVSGVEWVITRDIRVRFWSAGHFSVWCERISAWIAGNSTKTSSCQLHLLLPDQASPANHKVPAASQGRACLNMCLRGEISGLASFVLVFLCSLHCFSCRCVYVFVCFSLQELLTCCEEGKGEIKDGLEVMLSVPKRANDAMHLSMLDGEQTHSVQIHKSASNGTHLFLFFMHACSPLSVVTSD